MTDLGTTKDARTELGIEAYRSSSVAYDVAMRRLEEQMRQIDSIDTKVALIITSSAAIATLFVGFAGSTVDASRDLPVIVTIAMVALVTSVFMRIVTLGFEALWFNTWSLRPHWRTLLEVSSANQLELVQSWVAANCVESLEKNEQGIERKLKAAGRSYGWLVAEVLAASSATVVVVLANRLAA